MSESFDQTVKRLCRTKITDPDAPILADEFTVGEAVAAALIKRANTGAIDAVRMLREILGDEIPDTPKEFSVDIKVID